MNCIPRTLKTQLNIGLETIIIPYAYDDAYAAIHNVKGWVASARFDPVDNRFRGYVWFNTPNFELYDDYWKTRRSYKTRECALRAAGRCMLVLIAWRRREREGGAL